MNNKIDESNIDNNSPDDLLRELVRAIERRWEGESERKRSNAVSPRMESAIHYAKIYLGMPSNYREDDFQ